MDVMTLFNHFGSTSQKYHRFQKGCLQLYHQLWNQGSIRKVPFKHLCLCFHFNWDFYFYVITFKISQRTYFAFNILLLTFLDERNKSERLLPTWNNWKRLGACKHCLKVKQNVSLVNYHTSQSHDWAGMMWKGRWSDSIL